MHKTCNDYSVHAYNLKSNFLSAGCDQMIVDYEVVGQGELKDMGSFSGFSATRGTLVALEWHERS